MRRQVKIQAKQVKKLIVKRLGNFQTPALFRCQAVIGYTVTATHECQRNELQTSETITMSRRLSDASPHPLSVFPVSYAVDGVIRRRSLQLK